MVNSFVRSLNWLEKAAPGEVVTRSDWNRDDAVRTTFVEVYAKIRDLFDHQGGIGADAVGSTYEFASSSYRGLPGPDVKVAVAATFTNRFIDAAIKKYPA